MNLQLSLVKCRWIYSCLQQNVDECTAASRMQMNVQRPLAECRRMYSCLQQNVDGCTPACGLLTRRIVLTTTFLLIPHLSPRYWLESGISTHPTQHNPPQVNLNIETYELNSYRKLWKRKTTCNKTICFVTTSNAIIVLLSCRLLFLCFLINPV